MKFWKRAIITLALVLPVFVLAACGRKSSSSSSKNETVKVGIMSTDKEIWTDIQSRLKKQASPSSWCSLPIITSRTKHLKMAIFN